MIPPAEVRTQWHGETPVGEVHGEVDASNAAAIATELRQLVSNRSTRLIVDLTGTRYLDSAGINLLFALGDELRARQLALQLVVPPTSPVARMLRLTSLDRSFETFAALADAP